MEAQDRAQSQGANCPPNWHPDSFGTLGSCQRQWEREPPRPVVLPTFSVGPIRQYKWLSHWHGGFVLQNRTRC
jgi:hypothetical protein